jgi:pseudouridine-5'-phosphate glycosidase
MLKLSPEVQHALDHHHPVVALESTIISHGLPYPENLRLARRVEAIIREEGAVPATIAIIDGVIQVGCSDAELSLLAQSEDVIKVSKRDFAYVLSQGRTGATTVSGTLLVAAMVGIPIFATGGLGGVHRGVFESFDISRDLEDLALHNVAIVSAGVKSILDIAKTLEYLETKGVEVIGYQTDLFPAFYTRTSPYKVDYRLDSAEEVARLMHAKFDSGLEGGILIANPIPKEHSLPEALMEEAIQKALASMQEKGIKGKEITPYLLSEVKALTGGQSLASNIALMEHNARIAAHIAVAYRP